MILEESRLLQSRLDSFRPQRKSDQNIVRTFTNLMLVGKVTAALRLVSENAKGKVLPLTTELLNDLKIKHPNAEIASPSAVVPDLAVTVNPIIFAGHSAQQEPLDHQGVTPINGA